MKGHMEDGKFHPHKPYQKGVRKSREQTKKTEGVRLKRHHSMLKPPHEGEGIGICEICGEYGECLDICDCSDCRKRQIRKSRGDIKPKLPKRDTPEWNKLKDEVEKRLDHDFNQIRLENLQKVNEYWFEDVITAEPTDEMIMDHLGIKTLKGVDENEIEDAKQELYDDQREIMWGILFEAKDSMLAEKIKQNSDALINDAGITIIDMSNSDKADAYQTGVFLGINGAGYDFYEQHWIPMYRIFGWI